MVLMADDWAGLVFFESRASETYLLTRAKSMNVIDA